MFEGTLENIFISPQKAEPLHEVGEARAVPGKGLEGDRYFDNSGTFSKEKRKPDSEVTLIEAEAVESVGTIAPGQSRRNLLTRGVPLNHLVGVDFFVGEVRLRGLKLCEPCGHLEKLTQPGVKQDFLHRGGLRAQVLTEGVLKKGDAIKRVSA